MATYYLIKKKTHSFLTQQLNIFCPLKDSRSLLFSKFPSEPLNPSKIFLKCFIIVTSYLILIYIFYSYLSPGILKFWCLVTMVFKFPELYGNIYKNNSQSVDKSISVVTCITKDIAIRITSNVSLIQNKKKITGK